MTSCWQCCTDLVMLSYSRFVLCALLGAGLHFGALRETRLFEQIVLGTRCYLTHCAQEHQQPRFLVFYRRFSVENVTSSEFTVFKKSNLGAARWNSRYRHLLPKLGDPSSTPASTQKRTERTNFRESSSMRVYHGMHALSPSIRHAHTSSMHASAHTDTHTHK